MRHVALALLLLALAGCGGSQPPVALATVELPVRGPGDS